MTKKTHKKPPVKAGDKQVKRDAHGRFPKGVSGNPSGAPPGARRSTIKRDFAEMLQSIHDSTNKSFQTLWLERMRNLLIAGEVNLSKFWVEQYEGKAVLPVMQAPQDERTEPANQQAKKLIADFNAALRDQMNEEGDDNEEQLFVPANSGQTQAH